MKRHAPITVVERLRHIGPYVLIELLLPGGTLLALILWLFNRARGQLGKARLAADIAPVVERVVGLPIDPAAVIV
jgi:hypothetical protein